jgi:hypothetical protein
MAPTTAKLKHDINRGRAGDNVDAFDPAAAPLGTDEEAAGTPPSSDAIALAHKQEITDAPDHRNVRTATTRSPSMWALSVRSPHLWDWQSG